MIRPLRKRHLAFFLVIAISIPILFIAGLLARPAPIYHNSNPALNAVPDLSDAEVIQASFIPSPNLPDIGYQVLALPNSRRYIQLKESSATASHPLQVYWAAHSEGLTSSLTPGLPADPSQLLDAMHLGSWSLATTSAFELPDYPQSGNLIFYDQATKEISALISLNLP